MAANEFECKNPQKSPSITNYICICGKNYKHMSSLCKHKSKCGDNDMEKEDKIIKKIAKEVIIDK
jgi:hypothetical protein